MTPQGYKFEMVRLCVGEREVQKEMGERKGENGEKESWSDRGREKGEERPLEEQRGREWRKGE